MVLKLTLRHIYISLSLSNSLCLSLSLAPRPSEFATCFLDPCRHLQECSGARAGRCLTECFLEYFWAPASECPKECFLCAFWLFLGGPKKHSNSTLWGTPRQVPESTQKALCGHFLARAPEHSCIWRQGSQILLLSAIYSIIF